jgi:predicted metal-dependent hydrolase
MIVVGDIHVEVTRKRIKHLHLRVHSPDGHVRVSAPRSLRLQDVEAFVASRLEWIRRHQDRIQKLPRVQPPQFIDGECHLMWGRPHLLNVVERDDRHGVSITDDHMTLFVRPGSDVSARARVMQAWHKSTLSEALPPLIQIWEQRLNVRPGGYSLRRMTTRWGTCNPRTKHIRLNTELVTKPSRLTEYVVVHEMVHLIVPNHGARFVALMNQHYPGWRSARKELNGSGSQTR